MLQIEGSKWKGTVKRLKNIFINQSVVGIIGEIEENFGQWDKTIICLCLQKVMEEVYTGFYDYGALK